MPDAYFLKESKEKQSANQFEKYKKNFCGIPFFGFTERENLLLHEVHLLVSLYSIVESAICHKHVTQNENAIDSVTFFGKYVYS